MRFKFRLHFLGPESNGLVLFNCTEALKGIAIITDATAGL